MFGEGEGEEVGEEGARGEDRGRLEVREAAAGGVAAEGGGAGGVEGGPVEEEGGEGPGGVVGWAEEQVKRGEVEVTLCSGERRRRVGGY